MRIVFLGTSGFGIPALKSLLENGHQIVGIVSTPASEKGRGLVTTDSDIVQYAKEKGLSPIFTPLDLKSNQLKLDLESCNADVFVVVAFRILPKEIFSIPPLGTYNIHASLLPRYRGPAPIHRAIEAGEKETGVTIFRIDSGVDTGTIVLCKKAIIGDDETTPELSKRLSTLGAEGITEALALLAQGKVTFVEQDTKSASKAPKLIKAEGKLQWNLPSIVIYNKIRAFKPFPGSWAFFEGKRLSIEDARPVAHNDAHNVPGTIISILEDGFEVQCLKSSIVVVKVKPEGKKSMRGVDFVNGRNIRKGMMLS